jgi:hypothetical protein
MVTTSVHLALPQGTYELCDKIDGKAGKCGGN